MTKTFSDLMSETAMDILLNSFQISIFLKWNNNNYHNRCMKFYQKVFSLEAEFTNIGPAERVYFGISLK